MTDAGNGGNAIAHLDDRTDLAVRSIEGGGIDLGLEKVDDLLTGGEHLRGIAEALLHLLETALEAPVEFLTADGDLKAAEEGLILPQLNGHLGHLIFFIEKRFDFAQLLRSGRRNKGEHGTKLCGFLFLPLLIGVQNLIQCINAACLQAFEQRLHLVLTGHWSHLLHLLPLRTYHTASGYL